MSLRDTNDSPSEKPAVVASVPESDLCDPGNQSSYKASIDSRANPEADNALPEFRIHLNNDKSDRKADPENPGNDGHTPGPEQPLKVETDEKGNTISAYPDGRI